MSEKESTSSPENKDRVAVKHFLPHDNDDYSSSKRQKLDSTSENQEESKDEKPDERNSEFSSLVAAHYNSLGKSGFLVRDVSRIYHLRNFNNWIKGMLIIESASLLGEKNPLIVLDMCCGKGGDLFKWMKLNIKYLICTDIAEKSLEEYKERIRQFEGRLARDGKKLPFKYYMMPADCTKVRLRSKFEDASVKLDLVSCQFSFHYCFESLPQAECMLKNASECLKPGGLFIGTLPNAYEIVKRVRQSGSNGFKNDVFSLEMCCSEPYELFGAKYNFQLEGVVNCPEFLVHFPTFKKLAEKFGLKLVRMEPFSEFFDKRKNTRQGYILLKKMIALETYPPSKRKLSGAESDYEHAKLVCEEENASYVGTLSKSEWEVITLYQTFIFQKVKTTYDANGYPQYEF